MEVRPIILHWKAVGRWKAAVEMLQDYQSRLQWLLSIHVSVEAVGFEMVLHTSKTGSTMVPCARVCDLGFSLECCEVFHCFGSNN